jgi:hypothetical protein
MNSQRRMIERGAMGIVTIKYETENTLTNQLFSSFHSSFPSIATLLARVGYVGFFIAVTVAFPIEAITF